MPLLISEHPDQLIAVERGYGTDAAGNTITRPQDYLDAFGSWIRSHRNDIPALLAVCTRPRDLTRAQLKELRLALDTAGFPESALQVATRTATNADIAATIIGLIRHQALGSPLLPYEQRVAAAVAKLEAAHAFTQPQREWLRRIQKQLLKEVVVDRKALDGGAFRDHGGFARLDRIFGGDLQGLLGELQERIWEDAG